MALSLKKQRFVEEYLVDLNGTAAAIRAGYSIRSAKQIAHTLREDKEVDDAIERGQADMVALARGMLFDPRWGWHAAAELGATAHVPPWGWDSSWANGFRRPACAAASIEPFSVERGSN